MDLLFPFGESYLVPHPSKPFCTKSDFKVGQTRGSHTVTNMHFTLWDTICCCLEI